MRNMTDVLLKPGRRILPLQSKSKYKAPLPLSDMVSSPRQAVSVPVVPDLSHQLHLMASGM